MAMDGAGCHTGPRLCSLQEAGRGPAGQLTQASHAGQRPGERRAPSARTPAGPRAAGGATLATVRAGWQSHPTEFLDLTSVTLDEFQALARVSEKKRRGTNIPRRGVWRVRRCRPPRWVEQNEGLTTARIWTNWMIGRHAGRKVRDGSSITFTSGTGGRAQDISATYVHADDKPTADARRARDQSDVRA